MLSDGTRIQYETFLHYIRFVTDRFSFFVYVCVYVFMNRTFFCVAFGQLTEAYKWCWSLCGVWWKRTVSQFLRMNEFPSRKRYLLENFDEWPHTTSFPWIVRTLSSTWLLIFIDLPFINSEIDFGNPWLDNIQIVHYNGNDWFMSFQL